LTLDKHKLLRFLLFIADKILELTLKISANFELCFDGLTGVLNNRNISIPQLSDQGPVRTSEPSAKFCSESLVFLNTAVVYVGLQIQSHINLQQKTRLQQQQHPLKMKL